MTGLNATECLLAAGRELEGKVHLDKQPDVDRVEGVRRSREGLRRAETQRRKNKTRSQWNGCASLWPRERLKKQAFSRGCVCTLFFVVLFISKQILAF